MPRTSVTACSSETGFRVTPSFSVRVLVSLPQGTSGAQTTSLTPSSEESRPVTPAGLPGVVMRVRVLVTKMVCASTWEASAAFFMVDSLAVARTSTSAPSPSWVTRSWEPAKLKRTSTPGLAASKVFSSSPKVSVSEAAA